VFVCGCVCACVCVYRRNKKDLGMFEKLHVYYYIMRFSICVHMCMHAYIDTRITGGD
jgi:hypothetical protein